MKPAVFLLTVAVIIVIVGTPTAINSATMPKAPIPKPAANAWSEPIKGLSGRLIVEFEDLRPGLRHAVYLELKNHSFDPVAVSNQPRIHAELFDSSGKPVTTSAFALGGPMHIPQWAVIPRDAYLGFRIDMQIVDVPTREQGMALIAVGGKTWKLRAGKYVLEIVLGSKNEEDGPPNQWVGELKLPPAEVVVTAEMLAVK